MSRLPISKLAKDKAALAFLNKHRNDPVIGGGFSAATPHNNFTKVLNFKRKRVVDAITEVLHLLTPRDRELMEMFLQMPPRKIAAKLHKSRKWVYTRIRAVRERCLKMAAKKREDYIDQRDACDDGPESTPATIASRVLALTLNERAVFVYYVDRLNAWVDEDGKVFSEEISEILNNYREDLGEESILEIEEL